MNKLITILFIASVNAVQPPPSPPTSPPRHRPPDMLTTYRPKTTHKTITPSPPRRPFAAVVPSEKPNILRSSPRSDIVRQSNGINQNGSYQWSYQSDNGVSVEESGRLLNSPEGPIVATGTFQYRSLDGSPISVTYVADENGFQPVGDHLPVAPPIPPLIARALEWISAHSETTEKD